MKKCLTLSLILLFITPMLAQAQTKQETVDWLNKYGSEIISEYYQLDSFLGGDLEYQWMDRRPIKFTISANGNVEISARIEAVIKEDGYRGGEKTYESMSLIFNFEDLDPSTIDVNEIFNLYCHSAMCMEYAAYDHMNRSRRSTREEISQIKLNTQKKQQFDSNPDVERFRKALTHAIEIFGGKTVKKDLFDGN